MIPQEPSATPEIRPPRLNRRQYMALTGLFVAAALLLTAYESVKQWLFPDITVGQSQLMTVAVGSLAAAAAAWVALHFRQKDLVQIKYLEQLEAALRRREAQYRAIVDGQSLLICHFTPDGVLTFVNDTYCRYMNSPREELLGRSVFSFLAPEIRETARTDLVALAKGKKLALAEERLLLPHNTDIWIRWTDRPLFDDEGNLLGFQAEGVDITAQVRAKQILSLQRDLTAALNTDGPLPEIMHEILKVMLRIEQIDSGGVYLVDPQTGDVNLIAHSGLSAEFVAAATHYPADSPQVRLIQSGQSLYTHSDALKTDTVDFRRSEGLRALAVIPARHEGRAVAAMNLASHQYDEIPEYVRQMIDTLARQIGGGIARLRAEKALLAGRKNLQALFDTVNDFLFILDEQGRIAHINPVVEQRLGYTFEELRGKPVLEVHPPPRRDEAAQIVADMLADKRVSCPVPLQTKNGDLIPVDTKVTPGVWNDKPALFGLSRDITELVESRQQLENALQEKEALLKEIHHRVKNNLQIVASLLYLQAKQVADDDTLAVLQESRNRVKSMALIHEQLYQSGNLARIDMAVYLEKLANQLLQMYRLPNHSVSLALDIETLFLDIATAIPCGLIVNELVSNALKHAFVPGQAGRIAIRFARASGQKQYMLVVSDDGQGLPVAVIERVNPKEVVAASSQSLGLRLVDTLVGQLEGDMQIDYEHGVAFTITF